MGKYLVIGDSHIPRRATDIAVEIYDIITELTQNKLFDYTFFTGDLIKAPKFIDFLNLKTKNNVFVVIGNMDYFDGNRDAPLYQKLELNLKNDEKIVIGLTHGAQIQPRGDRSQIEYLATEKNYNIIISGHTHHEDIFLTDKGILLLNPGSVTGAWSFVASGILSFILLEIDEINKQIQVILYQLDKKSGNINEFKYFFKWKNNQIQNKF